MTIAEIHGKMRPYEGMEDLLTSDVFSAFKYCPPGEGILPFLLKGQRFGTNEPPDFPEHITNVKYYFWPRSHDNREPDLIMIMTAEAGMSIAVNIEAKYMSGKHNSFIEDYSETVVGALSGDQLYDQYAEGTKKHYSGELGSALKNVSEFYLFYVTAHYMPPADDIRETAAKCAAQGDSRALAKFFWLNWQSAYDVSAKSGNIVLQDLAKLLKCKRLAGLSLWESNVIPLPEGRNFYQKTRSFWQGIGANGMRAASVYLDSSRKLFNGSSSKEKENDQ